jgi:cell wall assembly regulator SMI1
MSVRESWSRIAAWAEANIPPDKFRLAAGATEQQIADLETLLGFPLPEDVRESYQIHNGTDETVFPRWPTDGDFPCYPAYGELVTLEFMGLMYQRHCEFELGKNAAEIVTPEIKPFHWNSRRLVLTDDASSSGLRVDLDPAEAGTFGQILHHDRSFGPIKVISPSWAAMLQRIAEDIDAGIYYYSEDLTWSRKDHSNQ